MVRAGMPLWSVLCLVSLTGQVAATPPGQPADTAPAISCEQPTNSTAVAPPKSEADVISLINSWMAYKETTSQMETWWRERSRQPDALAVKPVSPVPGGAISQHRTDLRPATMATPQRPHYRQRPYTAPATEFGCPPSVCASPHDQRQQQYQQAVQLYRQAEELYRRQLELQRAEQGR